MFQLISVLVTSLILASTTFAQNVSWGINLGGSDWDEAFCIEQTSDGGYIVVGESRSNDHDVLGNYGDYDYWVVKLNASGNVLWTGNYGGSKKDVARSIKQTFDGGYIVAGFSESADSNVSGNHGQRDFWIVKLNASGVIQWERNYGGTSNEEANSIQQTTDGGYILAGYSRSNNKDVSGNHGHRDYWVLKLNSSGAIEWQQSYGGSLRDEATTIQQTIDGGYIVAGFSYSNDFDVSGNYGDSDYWVVKLDSIGMIQWEQNYGGSTSEYCSYNSIQQMLDGGYMAVLHTESNDYDVSNLYSPPDYWVIKLDALGKIQWEQNYGGSNYDDGRCIYQTTDGRMLIGGVTNSNDIDVSNNYGSSDIWILKLDTVGTIQSEHNYGGSSTDVVWFIQETMDGGIVLCGSSLSSDFDVQGNNGHYDFLIIKVDCSANSNGTIDTTLCSGYTSPSGNYIWTVTGNYLDTIPNSLGCDSVVTIQLVINAPDTTVTQSGSTLTADELGAQYQWIDCDQGNAPIVGETGRSFTPAISGNYAVVITDTNCTDTSGCHNVTIVGVSDGITESWIRIYPNPTTNDVIITVDIPYSLAELKVTNTLGQILDKNQIQKGGVINLELSGPSGVYFIQAKTGDGQTATFKVFKQ